MATYSTSKRLIKAYDGKSMSRAYISFGPVMNKPKRLRVRFVLSPHYVSRRKTKIVMFLLDYVS